jgi:UDP-glucuronate 4-epimerase
MIKSKKQKVALVTGSAGFIGFHLSKRFLDEGWRVVGLDSMSDYYDVSLKESREDILLQYSAYSSIHEKVEKPNILLKIFEKEKPDIVVHLAAQAGVRYSIENPRIYIKSNIIGTFELLEAARVFPPKHMLLASTSSAYGVNKKMPFKEKDKADHQISFYAATKKSTENIAHSYSHLFNLPITMFRFFTVYGPWGRPDMALFKFTKAILEGKKIDVYNNGNMSRDFTYIDDLIEAIMQLLFLVPEIKKQIKPGQAETDHISPVAPFRIVNIGNSKPEKLTDFIKSIENSIGIKAKINLMPMQPGDVSETWADTNFLKQLTGFSPKTKISDGVKSFVNWYRKYYK